MRSHPNIRIAGFDRRRWGYFFAGCPKAPPGAETSPGRAPRMRGQRTARRAGPGRSNFSLGSRRHHYLSDLGPLASSDLQHGAAAARLALTRNGRARTTLNTHFGPGWSDLNWVRCARGQELAHPLAPRCRLADGARSGPGRIRRDDGERSGKHPRAGWPGCARLVLTFASDGPPRLGETGGWRGVQFTWDEKGRLVSVGTGPENLLRYQL